MAIVEQLTEEQKQRLAAFDPAKPCVIKASEIEGFAEYGDQRFVFKRPTVGDRLKIGIREAKYKENLDLDVAYGNIAHLLATFSVVCTEAPKGFVFDEVFDFDPLFALFDRFNEWLSFFRLSVQLRKEILSGEGK